MDTAAIASTSFSGQNDKSRASQYLAPSESNNTIMTTQTTDLLLTPSTAGHPPMAPSTSSYVYHEDAAEKLNPSNCQSPETDVVTSSTRANSSTGRKKKSEPVCILIFKSVVIVVGLGMLAVVFYFMGDVIYDWLSGNLAQQREEERQAFLNRSESKP